MTLSDLWTFKLLAFSIIWITGSLFYFIYKDYDVNVKTVSIIFFPLIMFMVWFFIFWWG